MQADVEPRQAARVMGGVWAALGGFACAVSVYLAWQHASLATGALVLPMAAGTAWMARASHRLAELQDSLQAAHRAKAEFLAALSQEISTPLNGMFGMTSLLLDTQLDTRQRRFAQVIQNSGESMMRIVNATVDYAQVEAGKLQLEQFDFALTDLLEHAIEDFAGAAADKDLQMFLCISPEVPRWVRGDPLRLQEVLGHLLSNAVKFTELGSVVVRVRAEMHGSAQYTVHIMVEDSGPGMEASTRERLFIAFNQTDVSTRHKATGAGLGLATASRLVRLMGGGMAVASEPARGTRMMFTVELVRVEGAEPLERARPLPGGKRALVVEPHPVVRAMLAEQLRIWGLEVQAVPSGSAALHALAHDGYDVVLAPAAMPQIISVQRGSERAAPVLLRIAEHDAPPIMATDPETGMTLTKPLRPSLLRAFLANVLR